MTNTHLIQKQDIELIFTSDHQVESLWQEFLNFHKDEAHPLMNTLFDEIAGEENWVHIPKLEIDLGVISERSFKQLYLDQLRQCLEKSLQEKISKEKIISTDVISAWEYNIIYYLKHGFFFWETIAQSIKKREGKAVRDIMEQKILELVSGSPSFIRSLYRCFSGDQIALQRWVRQFRPGFHSQVKEILIKDKSSYLSAITVSSCRLMEIVMERKTNPAASWQEGTQFSTWLILFSDSLRQVQHHLKEWILDQLPVDKLQQWINTIFKKGNDKVQQELVNYFLHNYSLLVNEPSRENFSDHHHEISASMNAWFNSKNIAVEEIEDDHVLAKRVSDVADVPVSGSKIPENKNDNDLITDPIEIFTPTGQQDFEKRFKENNTTVTENETMYVDNAGLVLIHPFIENFFKNTGIDTKEKLSDDKVASVGIQLLQLAVSGEWDAEESRLSLNKILCGRMPGWPAYRVEAMPENALSECQNLLQTIINYWSALKKTSIDGLRETFLQRQGKLVLKEDQWQLLIEYKTPDILLGMMPWSYSVIKLPWMQHPLYIEW